MGGGVVTCLKKPTPECRCQRDKSKRALVINWWPATSREFLGIARSFSGGWIDRRWCPDSLGLVSGLLRIAEVMVGRMNWAKSDDAVCMIKDRDESSIALVAPANQSYARFSTVISSSATARCCCADR